MLTNDDDRPDDTTSDLSVRSDHAVFYEGPEDIEVQTHPLSILGMTDCPTCGGQHYGNEPCSQLCTVCDTRFAVGDELKTVVDGLDFGILRVRFVHANCSVKS